MSSTVKTSDTVPPRQLDTGATKPRQQLTVLGPYSVLRRSEEERTQDKGQVAHDDSSSEATMAYLRSLRSASTGRPDVHDRVSLLPAWHRPGSSWMNSEAGSEPISAKSTRSSWLLAGAPQSGAPDCEAIELNGNSSVRPICEPSTALSDCGTRKAKTEVDDDIQSLRTRMAEVVRL